MSDSLKDRFTKLFNNEMEFEEARSMLEELYKKGESAEDIAAAAEVMRSFSVSLPVPKELSGRLIDVVGTGGDKSGSFNVSSTSALLLAAAGSYVAKHGNRSVTSKSGSADMLEALGIRLDLEPDQQVRLLEKTGFCFIFAMRHHPAMKHIMPIRKSIEHRTIFNLLGPLTNPAKPKRYLLGVFDPSFVSKVAEALSLIGVERALIVSSEDGMDEISIFAPTQAVLLEDGERRPFIIDPFEFFDGGYGFSDIQGGDARYNAKITSGLLKGEIKGAKLDMLLLNSAAALWVDKKVSNIKEGIEFARELIESKKAQEKLEEIVEESGRLAENG